MARKVELDFSTFSDTDKAKDPVTQERQDELDFARLLEINGFVGALKLIDEKIKPLAKKECLTLFDAAWKYANANEDQDTSWYQLYLVLLHLPNWVYRGIQRPQPTNGSGK